MKSLLRTVAIVLLFIVACQRNAFGQTAPEEIWVQIRYQDRGIEQPATECYGMIHKADLAAMLNVTGKIAGFIRVARVATMENGQVLRLADANISGVKLGFKNVIYIRADTILKIVELDDTFVTERLLPLKE